MLGGFVWFPSKEMIGKQHSKKAVLAHAPFISNLFGVHVFVGIGVYEALCKLNLMREIDPFLPPPTKETASKKGQEKISQVETVFGFRRFCVCLLHMTGPQPTSPLGWEPTLKKKRPDKRYSNKWANVPNLF